MALLCGMLWALALVSGTVSLEVTVSTSKPAFATIEPVVVHVKLTNPSSQATKFMKWHSPLEPGGIFHPIFSITRDDVPVRYLGPLAIFDRPEYITVDANSEVTGSIDLTEYYDFSISGSYSIQYDVAAIGLFDEEDHGLQSLSSNPLTVAIDGRGNPSALLRTSSRWQTLADSTGSATVPGGAVPTIPEFKDCSAPQQQILRAVRRHAVNLVKDAVQYLQSPTEYSAVSLRYDKWFGGKLNPNSYGEVRSNFQKILYSLQKQEVYYVCSSDPAKAAWTVVNPTGMVYVGGAFWTSQLEGKDGQAGSFVHIFSKFDLAMGASSKDTAIGFQAALDLAKGTTPVNTKTNGPSYRYFAENDPFVGKTELPSPSPGPSGSPNDICYGNSNRTVTAAASILIDRGNYAANEYCKVLIRATKGLVVQCTFATLNTVKSRDLLSFYDGTNERAPMLADGSGPAVPNPAVAISSSNVGLVVWTSSNDGKGKGWTMRCIGVDPAQDTGPASAAQESSLRSHKEKFHAQAVEDAVQQPRQVFTAAAAILAVLVAALAFALRHQRAPPLQGQTIEVDINEE